MSNRKPEKKSLIGQSRLTVGLCLVPRIQKMRDETAATCDDIVLSDGTIMFSKEAGLALVAQYDALLDTLNHQDSVVAVDPKYPFSCCEPPSCDH